MEEISKLAKNLGYSEEMVMDNSDITEDKNLLKKKQEKEKIAVENRRRRNQKIFEKKRKKRNIQR